MTQTEFVERLAWELGESKIEARHALHAVLRSVERALAEGEDVRLPGFGRFSVAERAARETADPRDRTRRIAVPARRVPRFTAGARLKGAVN